VRRGRRRGLHTRVHERGAGGGHEGGVRARSGGGRQLGFQTIREAADGCDGWDQSVSVASDEPTVEN
jgi:hypothetical protein